MPYEFTEYPVEPDPQPASSRGTRPPRKGIGVDVLDAPGGSRLHFRWWLAALLLVGSVIILLALSGRL
ncbi:MAG: hypothetical protein WBQ63_12315 [Candidatus Acidiferrales bacterium]